jgi:hypothetical protein
VVFVEAQASRYIEKIDGILAKIQSRRDALT